MTWLYSNSSDMTLVMHCVPFSFEDPLAVQGPVPFPLSPVDLLPQLSERENCEAKEVCRFSKVQCVLDHYDGVRTDAL